jgi:hypothetical protein
VKLQQVITASLALVAIVAPAQAQQASVTVDGKKYSVNEMPGRTQHMVQLSGPEGMAMIAVNNQGKITMYASPAGGGTPDQKAIIDKVWNAYEAQKNGSAGASNQPPANDANDPNAALRQQQADAAAAMAAAAARLNGAGSRSSPGERKVELTDKVVVNDPDLNGKVTIATEDVRSKGGTASAGLQFTIVVDPGRGYPPEIQTWRYEGGMEPVMEGKKLLHGVKGGLEAMGNSMNTHADAGVNVCGNLDNCFSVIAKSGGHETKNEVGGAEASTYAANNSGRDPKYALETRTAHALSLDVAAARDAIAKAVADGKKAPTLDFDSGRSKRELAALDRIIGKAGYAPQ